MSAPPRLRLVVTRYGAEIVGGAERLARLLAHALRDRGWRVSVTTTCAFDERTWANAFASGSSVEEGIEVERHGVRMPRHHAAFREMSRLFWRLPPGLRPEAAWLALQGPWSPGLERSLRLHPEIPTLFISYLYRPTLWGVSAVQGPRLVLPTAHDERPLHLRRVGRMLEEVDGIWYATPEERDLVERTHPQARGRRSEVGNVAVASPSGLDPGRFRDAHHIEGPYVVYGGRATAGKGLDELLCAARRLHRSRPEASVVLTGEAGERTRPEPGIRPVGTLDERTRWDALAGATAVVVPSFHESLSLLALEGWAVGRPVLLNAMSPVLAGQAERSGGGLPYRGAEALAAAAERLLDDPALCARLGAAGQAHVGATYTWDAVVARLEGLLAAASPSAVARATSVATR